MCIIKSKEENKEWALPYIYPESSSTLSRIVFILGGSGWT
jgi:hypothetical protein